MPKPTPPTINSHPEITHLDPMSEILFRHWAKASGIQDVDEPDSFYDYRGLYKDTNGKIIPQSTNRHFPDTYKQHGHPTFSSESKYSLGPFDGGAWMPTNFLGPLAGSPAGMAISHATEDHLMQPPVPMPSHNAAPTEGDQQALPDLLFQRYLDTKDAQHKSLDKHAGFLEKVLKPILAPSPTPNVTMDGPGTGGIGGNEPTGDPLSDFLRSITTHGQGQ